MRGFLPVHLSLEPHVSAEKIKKEPGHQVEAKKKNVNSVFGRDIIKNEATSFCREKSQSLAHLVRMSNSTILRVLMSTNLCIYGILLVWMSMFRGHICGIIILSCRYVSVSVCVKRGFRRNQSSAYSGSETSFETHNCALQKLCEECEQSRSDAIARCNIFRRSQEPKVQRLSAC